TLEQPGVELGMIAGLIHENKDSRKFYQEWRGLTLMTIHAMSMPEPWSISRNRTMPGGRADRGELPRGPNGRILCRWCNLETPRGPGGLLLGLVRPRMAPANRPGVPSRSGFRA